MWGQCSYGYRQCEAGASETFGVLKSSGLRVGGVSRHDMAGEIGPNLESVSIFEWMDGSGYNKYVFQ